MSRLGLMLLRCPQIVCSGILAKAAELHVHAGCHDWLCPCQVLTTVQYCGKRCSCDPILANGSPSVPK